MIVIFIVKVFNLLIVIYSSINGWNHLVYMTLITLSPYLFNI